MISPWLIGLAVLIVYANSLKGPFVYDDLTSIVANPTIRDLTSIGDVLSPPSGDGRTVGGRPFLNFTLALNYAVSGTSVWSYHLLNVAIHLMAGLTLFGIVRRTLVSGAVGQSGGWAVGQPGGPAEVAFVAALLWSLHPLQTESVTYVVQRAESLMGLLYLLTLYCFIRAAENGPVLRQEATQGKKAGVWMYLSVLSCFFGVATKEVMVSAPVMVLLFDRTFFAGSFRDAWRLRHRLYLGLASSWVLLLLLVASTGGNRGGSIGLNLGLDWWSHALTQFRAVSRYLWLSFWPHPLVFDYGPETVSGLAGVLPFVAVVGVVALATLIGLWRGTFVGFAGAWFFAILAPTSLLPGATQMTVEHRMYLPLASVAVLVTAVLYSALGRRALVVGLLLAAALGVRTIVRNSDYRTEIALWSETAARVPGNVTAQKELGGALIRAGRTKEAIAILHDAVLIHPDSFGAHLNLGIALFNENRLNESFEVLQVALRLDPKSARVQANIASVLLQGGKIDEGVAAAREAVRLDPGLADAHAGLGTALLVSGKLDDSAVEFREALRLDSNNASAHMNFGNLLVQLKRYPDAVSQYREALELEPGGTDIRRNLGTVLVLSGHREEGVVVLRENQRLHPDDQPTRAILEKLGVPP